MYMLTLGDINTAMAELNDWSLESSSIVKIFQFKDFKESLLFVNRVAELAERHNHHPDIMLAYDTVRLSLTTKCDHGLTKKDFELAKEIDKIEL